MAIKRESTLARQSPDVASQCLAIAEHSPLPMAAVEGATHIVCYVNPAFCQLMDKPRDQLVGRPLDELLPEKDVCTTLVDRVFQNGTAERFTEREDSKAHPVFWSYTVWPVLAAEPFVGVMIQITETGKFHDRVVAMNEALMLGSVHQHELTDAAEGLNAKLQAEIAARKGTARELAEKARLVDLSNDAIIVYDLHGRIKLWNKGAEELYGWTSGEVMGRDIHKLLPTGYSKPLEEILAQLNEEGQFSGEVVQIARDERRVAALCRWVLDRETGSVLSSYTDISERKQFEGDRAAYLLREHALRMEAEGANRSKDLFLATLSHEVRTPLNAILGWATILRGSNCDEADVKEGMEVIERNCKVQAQLIEDVLDISRIVSGKLKLQICPCELVDIIEAALDVVRPAAQARNIRIQTTLDPAASHVSCDANRMQQVIWNLLANAIKFTPPGRTVRVSLAVERSTARIEVSDEGQGITPEFMPFVFDRFRQADSSTRRKMGGLGLGLSIVKHIVELHGGAVQVQSDGANRGACFTVNVPIRAVHTKTSDVEKGCESGDSLRRDVGSVRLDALRVLVVDDEPDARRLLVKVLSDAGCIVTAVESVPDAIIALEMTHPQVLLSDIAMPDFDGYDLIRNLRKAGRSAKDIPAVALSAFAHKDDRIRALRAGFQVHVAKPFDPNELIAIIASLIGFTA
jgi:PAS domain S-box-containing protein